MANIFDELKKEKEVSIFHTPRYTGESALVSGPAGYVPMESPLATRRPRQPAAGAPKPPPTASPPADVAQAFRQLDRVAKPDAWQTAHPLQYAMPQAPAQVPDAWQTARPPQWGIPAAPAPAFMPMPAPADIIQPFRQEEAKERQFQRWYADIARQMELSPDPNDPEHYYNYRAAYQAGAAPAIDPGSGELHLPSEFKLPGHPNQYVGGVDTITGLPAPDNMPEKLLPSQRQAVDQLKEAQRARGIMAGEAAVKPADPKKVKAELRDAVEKFKSFSPGIKQGIENFLYSIPRGLGKVFGLNYIAQHFPELPSEALERMTPEQIEYHKRAVELLTKEPGGTAEQVGEVMGQILPYVAAAGPVGGAVSGTTKAILTKYAPKLATTMLGKLLPSMAGSAATGAAVTAARQAVKGIAAPDEFELDEALKEISTEAARFAAFAGAGRLVGDPVRTKVGGALYRSMLSGRMNPALGQIITALSGGGSTGLTIASVETAIKYLHSPEEFDKADAAGDILTTALFFAGLDVLHTLGQIGPGFTHREVAAGGVKLDPYQELGLKPGATMDEVKRAYRTLAKQYHPDVARGGKDVQDRFVRIAKAYAEIMRGKPSITTELEKPPAKEQIPEGLLPAGRFTPTPAAASKTVTVKTERGTAAGEAEQKIRVETRATATTTTETKPAGSGEKDTPSYDEYIAAFDVPGVPIKYRPTLTKSGWQIMSDRGAIEVIPERPSMTFEEAADLAREKNIQGFKITGKIGADTKKKELKLPERENRMGVVGESLKEEASEIPPATRISSFIMERLGKGKQVAATELFKIATEAYGGTMAEGKFTVKDAYDAMELGINKYLAEKRKSIGPYITAAEAADELKKIEEEILKNIPTQTKRTAETDEFQQFSTPPHLAYTANWVANIHQGDVVLEPSAGIGGLAVFAKRRKVTVIVNELSERRATILKEMGFDRVFTENAEQLDNILPDDVKPTVVIMNPPFSATAGRMTGKRNTKFAEAHIEQALKRLEPGGRLVAIVGRGMADDAPAFRKWWDEIKGEYNVKANVGIAGKNYKKYGTQFDVQLLVIDKIGPTTKAPITSKVENLEDVLPLLEAVKNERTAIPESSKAVKSTPVKPTGQEITAGGEAESRPGSAVPVSTDRVGVDVAGHGSNRSGEPVGERRPAGNERISDVKARPEEGVRPAGRTGPREKPGVDKSERTGEGAVPEESGDVSGGKTQVGDRGKRPVPEGERWGRIEVESKESERVEGDLGDSIYSSYKPQRLKIKGAKDHPADLAQSAAMAAVEPPPVTYKPNLPEDVVTSGKLSLAQLEPVVYAGQAHEQTLPDGNRRGYFIGDGTGVGKGRIISGIIMDNQRQGRKKHVWVSKNKPLIEDAKRDFGDIGGNADEIFDIGKIKAGASVKQNEGIAFVTYDTLGQNLEIGRTGGLRAKQGKLSRLDQLTEWLGEEFDGVIAFDEAHAMQNAITQKGPRGKKDPAIRAIAGVELQRRLPKARMLYVSATGATEVHNLAYADRLGLWGEGTPFADKNDFIAKIHAGGLAAMELVARDMKAMGVYLARNLSFEGVSYETVEHNLTPEQTQIYDAIAEGWQIVLQNLHKALEITGQKSNAHARRNAAGQFWGAQQRFFNQVLTSLQMPTVIEKAKKDLKAGHAVVMQLVNTNEAVMNRRIAAMGEDQTLEELDLTPRDMLMQYLDHSFPIHQYEEYIDEDGNKRTRVVVDSQGNPVVSRGALAMKEELMSKLGAMKVPDGPLEMVLNTFGPEMVAEITGRSRRVVKKRDEETGRMKKVLERRTERHKKLDTDAFMDDKKQVLIFSDAGGTGRSYHADKTKKNQRKRIHYLIQPGWRADGAVQGFGRTHRSNQAGPPHYVLVTTNLKGQKRFISSIARRLDQLGALTKGQRQTGGQGLFSAKDNLESDMARNALERFYTDLMGGGIPGLKPKELLRKMGLENLVDKYGNLNQTDELRNIARFLNRVLSLDSSLQNHVFDEFSRRLDMMVEAAINAGTLDFGMENYKADKVSVKQEQVVFAEKQSGAETTYYELDVSHKNRKISYRELMDRNLANRGFYRNTRSNRVYALRNFGTTTAADGSIMQEYGQQGQTIRQSGSISQKELDKVSATGKPFWGKVPDDQAPDVWSEELKKTPEYYTERLHLISGTLLPIWDRLPEGKSRVIRIKTDDGRILLGRLIGERAISQVLKRLDADTGKIDFTPQEIVDFIFKEDYTVYLANEWKLSRRRVSGESRIEILGNDLWKFSEQLINAGAFPERIQWETRYFIPVGEEAAEVFKKITLNRPVVDLEPPARAEETLSLDDLKGEIGEKINEAVGDVNIPIGQSIRIVSGSPRSKGSFSSSDPDVDARVKASHGVKSPGVFSKIKELMDTIARKVSREYEHLPKGEEFAQLRFDLLQLAKQKGVASYNTLKLIQGILLEFDKDPAGYNHFEWKVLLSDLAEEAKLGHALPFGYTEDILNTDIDNLDKAIAAKFPQVERAMETRRKIWDTIVNEYTKAQEAIGHKVENKLARREYFRHQVMDYANEKAMRGMGKKLRTPTGRGFLKQREGSALDINTNYLEAEYEVMAQMLHDIEVAKVIKAIDERDNIVRTLKAQAVAENDKNIMPLFEQIAEQYNKSRDPDKQVTAESFYRRILNSKQAIGFEKLGKLAMRGELPVDSKGKYEKLIDALAETYITNASAKSPEEKVYLPEWAMKQVFPYLNWLLKQQHVTGKARGAAATVFKGIAEKKEYIKTALGDKYVTWEDLIPDGYVKWQPREGNVFYFADTIPAQKAQLLFAQGLAQVGLTADEVEQVLVMGQRLPEMVLKEEIALTLDNLVKDRQADMLSHTLRKMIQAWKVYQLISPKRWAKYNTRNVSGDADAAYVGNPSTFKKVPQAAKELLPVYFGDGAMTKNMRKYFERGGMQSTLQAQEMGDVNKLKMFVDLVERRGKITEIPVKLWQGYWKAARLSTDYREAILRYAAFLDYREQMKGNKEGRPKNFGASIPEEIMALKDIDDRAFWLSNDLLGAYDKVSVAGQWTRENLFPFWSWKEVNFKRYIQFAENAVRDEDLCRMVGRTTLAKLKRFPALALRVGKFLLKAVGLWALLEVYNHTFYSEEEFELPPDVRNTPHIVLGRDKQGRVKYFTRLGALGDFLEWFGLEEAPGLARDFLNGKKNLKEIAADMAKEPVNAFVQGIGPQYTIPIELMFGRKIFPDVFKPGMIRDRGYYIAQNLGLENEYAVMMKLPRRSYVDSLEKLVVYKQDPGQGAYYEILDLKREFQKKMGKSTGFMSEVSPKSQALYNLKLAVRYQDRAAFDKYAAEYISYGGTAKDFDTSLRNMHPLHGLSKEGKKAFYQWLDGDDRKRLGLAIMFYEETLLGKKKNEGE